MCPSHLLRDDPDIPHSYGDEEDTLEGHDDDVDVVDCVTVTHSDLKRVGP